MNRRDINENLTHWIKAESYEDAFRSLVSIASEAQLVGNNGRIKGGFNCVCFTEAPEDVFHAIDTRYQPFGIQIKKTWLANKGGRNVIYQPDTEFDLLPDELKWRHVRYEPNANPPIDFSWEREWRVRTNCLTLEPADVSLLVPDSSWHQRLLEEHENEEHWRIHAEAVAYGEEWMLQHPRPLEYRVVCIS